MLLFLLEGTLSQRFFVLVCLFLVVKTKTKQNKKNYLKTWCCRNKLTLFGIGHQEPWSRVVHTGEGNELGEKKL